MKLRDPKHLEVSDLDPILSGGGENPPEVTTPAAETVKPADSAISADAKAETPVVKKETKYTEENKPKLGHGWGGTVDLGSNSMPGWGGSGGWGR